MSTKGMVLPYRCSGDDVVRLLEARARGRDMNQIQALNFSAKTFEGTVLTATELGFLNEDTRDLTASGRAFALAQPEERPDIMFAAIMGYEPYSLLLEAIFSKNTPHNTELDWVERWWSTQKYGNSQSNRSEACSGFGKLVEFAGLGTYIMGRRGNTTRIEWRQDAGDRVRQAASEAPVDGSLHSPATPHDGGVVQRPIPVQSTPQTDPNPGKVDPASRRREGNTFLSLSLSEDRVAEISLPARLSTTEKTRLLSLIELLVTTEAESQQEG